MRLAVALLLVTATLVPLGFSGCVSCEEGPPVTARGIDRAPSSDGTGPYRLQVQVIDAHTGDILPGAGVVVYWGGDRVGEWDHPFIQVGPDRVIVEPDPDAETAEPASTLRLRSDGDGRVRAQVPENRILGIVAAKDGWTEEWLPAIASGEGGGGDTITVPLYRSHLDVVLNGTWSPGAASSGFVTSSQYAWDPVEVPFGDAEDTNRGYASRIVGLEVTLEWENGIDGVGDLGIGVGPQPGDGPTYFADGGENLGSGAQSESATLAAEDLAQHGILGPSPIHVGAATKSGYLAPFGLDYTLRISADFDAALAELSDCLNDGVDDDSEGVGVSVPGPGVVSALSLVALAALARRLP